MARPGRGTGRPASSHSSEQRSGLISTGSTVASLEGPVLFSGVFSSENGQPLKVLFGGFNSILPFSSLFRVTDFLHLTFPNKEILFQRSIIDFDMRKVSKLFEIFLDSVRCICSI